MTAPKGEEALERRTVDLAHALALIRATLESTTDGILATDAEGRVTSINEKFLQMWRIGRETMTGTAYVQLQGAFSGQFAEPEPYLARVRDIYASWPPETFDQLELRDGRVFDRYSRIQRVEGRAVGRVWCFHDTTERRQKETALARIYHAEQQARGAAEQANKAKDHFLATLSHELRTPLTPVLAILSSLNERGPLPAALAEDLEIMGRNIELEARLIDDLLDLTRITRGKLDLQCAAVAADQLIENAIDTCRADLIAKHQSLVREFPASAPVLFADGTRVTQILWNLLKNAIKFTPVGGTITLRTRVAAAVGATHWVVEIEDTGVGITPGQLDRVFDAFEQVGRKTAASSGGLGLGLAISKGLAEAHGGVITAASGGDGQGSTFTLTLPIDDGVSAPPRPEPAHGAAVAAPRGPKAGGRPWRLLLVEDHADTSAILGRLLRSTGYDVINATSMAEARAMAAREAAGPGLDLILSDLGLPDGSGLELMRELAAAHGLRGIALSGFGMDTDIAESLAAGFSRHLIKPINIGVLRGTIAEILESAGAPVA
jgi:PAS domain S-box-containing protein